MKKKSTSFITLTFVGIFTLISQGCATSNSRGNDPAHDAPDAALNQDVDYIIKPGDRLGDIAEAFTGKVSLWKEIANYNNITDPRSLRVGDVITIPANLIPASKRLLPTDETSKRELPSKSQSIAAASNSSTQSSIASSSALAVVQGSAKPDNNEADVVLQGVSINRSFELNAIDESDLNRPTPSRQDLAAPQVKVVGSYYPKGIYEKPASNAALLMRVAPGTVVELERELDDWFKVVTSKGIGYLRMKDGAIVEN